MSTQCNLTTFCLVLIFLIGKVDYPASLRRVCYYTNWAQYRNGPGKFYPENVDPSLCTHIIYAFAKMVGNHLAAFEWNDESTAWMKGMYERFSEIKTQNPSVKLLLAVGGWNMGSAPFTQMVASAAGRQEFAKTTVTFLRKNNFDGLDMDWEYPANRGSPSGDKHKFTLLLQDLHDEFARESVPAGKERLMLTAAVAAGKDKIDTAYEVPEISRLLDFINLMTYDLHGSWEDHTGHNAPLYARSSETGNDTYLNVDWAAQYWVQKGAPREKLNIGLALYGRSFKLPWSHTSDMIGCAAAGAGEAGLYTREAGFKSYYEVCEKLANGATRRYEPEQKVPYLVMKDLWVGYDDPDSLKVKVDYVKQENFGGIMVWALDLDDFSGMCGQGKYPLMNAIINEINSASGPVNPPITNPVPTTTTTRAITHAPAYTNPPANTQAPVVSTSLRRVCYYTNWAQYRNGPGKFYPENVDPSLCTHIIYAFAKMVGNHLAAFEWNDESTAWMKGMYERFSEIKTQNPSVKLLLAVGGWNMGSAPFTQMVATAAGRQEFAKTTVTFLRKNNFDGLDMDWEYPANRGSPPGDKHKFTLLLQDLHDEFARESVPAGKERLMLTAAVAAGKDKIDTAYEVPEISRLLDFINLMTYDLHGSWEDHTGHNAPLYARSSETGNDTYLNVDWAAQYWVQKGAPREKLNIGLALYGRSFKLPWSHTSDMIGCAAAGAGEAGLYTREAGFKSYYEVCEKLANGATRRYEPEQKVPYLVMNDLWVGYDDPDSLKVKVDYVKQEHFGGIMVWALDLDDFSGMCGQGKYPLMNAIINEINSASGPVNPPSTYPVPITTTTTRATTHSPIFTNPPVTTQPPVVTTKAPEPTTTKAPVTTTIPPTTKAPVTTTIPPTTKAPVTTTIPPTTKAPATTKAASTTQAQAATTLAPGSNSNQHQLVQVSSNEFNCQIRTDGYYASPTSCSIYYICAAGMGFKTDCHPGLVFNPATLYCDFPDHVTCGAHNNPAAPVTTTTTTTQAPVTTRAPITTQAPVTTRAPITTQAPVTTRAPWPTTTRAAPMPTTTQAGPVNPTDFCKGKADGFYKDPTDCAHFYQCSFEVSYHEPCPSGTYYSVSLQGCDWAANVPQCP